MLVKTLEFDPIKVFHDASLRASSRAAAPIKVFQDAPVPATTQEHATAASNPRPALADRTNIQRLAAGLHLAASRKERKVRLHPGGAHGDTVAA